MLWALLLWTIVAARLLVIGLSARRGLRAVPLPHLHHEPPATTLVATPDARIHPADIAAARSDMTARGLDIVHLLPGAAPASYGMTIGQLIDGVLRSGSTSGGSGGTAFALLVRSEVLDRARQDVEPARADAARHVQLARRLARYGSVGYVRAPRSRLDDNPFDDRATVGQAYGTDLYTVFSIPLMLGLVAAGPFFAPVVGWIAVAMLHLAVPLALVGSPLRPAPSGVLVEGAVRWLDIFARWLRTLLQRPRRLMAEDAAPLRSWYADAVRNGTDHFFEPARTSCPMCDAATLKQHLEVGDLWQGKPGTFRLDACDGCGHIFQNPRLSIEGLNFYYRDFYDGLGEDGIELLFDSEGQPYGPRAEFVLAHGEPTSWLDVGCGHGHLCQAVKERLPDARVDGLDMSDGVEDARRRGWLDTAHTGLFPEMAERLAEQYDVVSMSHYLEHTRDPRAEVEAAATVLRPGGLLLIEVPDPSSWFGRMAKRFWLPWFQPQHQHFVQIEMLQRVMRESGLEPIANQRAEAHLPTEGILGAVSILATLSPTPEFPWLPPATLGRRVWNSMVWGLGGPLLLVGVLFDRYGAGLLTSTGASNTYRQLARKS
ncbi:MAG: class I SAM-dependent methyltransferase [Deltaproteobacteria bacterium]|nr:class I SAM-dependent methyltransferase [Deltaproteobacteria bacterium]